MRVALCSILASAVFSTVLSAQPPARTPGAEHKRLGLFLGQWRYEGETRDSPLGPAGKTSSTETCEWFAGGFHVICNSKGAGRMGAVVGHAVIGYDPAAGAYTYYGISSAGDGFYVLGRVDGNVWTWSSESMMDGKPVKFAVRITEQSPTVQVFRMEASFDGGPPMVVEEGRSTRIK